MLFGLGQRLSISDKLVFEGIAAWSVFPSKRIASRRAGLAEKLPCQEPALVHVEASMGTWLQDLGYALRQLHKSPGFTLTAVITLGLEIGTNTAVLTLIHGILRRSLPVCPATST